MWSRSQSTKLNGDHLLAAHAVEKRAGKILLLQLAIFLPCIVCFLPSFIICLSVSIHLSIS